MVPGNSVGPTPAIIIFAKAPIPGSVKTRLCPPLTPDEAASLHGTLVLDAVERAKAIPEASLYVAGTPDVTHPFFKVLEGRYGARLLLQRGEDLGNRMCHAMQEAFALGHSTVVLTGSDLPVLPRQWLKHALDLLRDHDVVLGPALDGGYYLIGLRRAIPALFTGITWSTRQVLQETQQAASAHGVSVALLPECRDLDDPDDLQAFITLRNTERTMSKRTEGALRLIAARLKDRTA